MKKIILIVTLSLVFCLGSVSAITVGGIGEFTDGGFYATGSSGKIEVELGITHLTNSQLSLSADYRLTGGAIAYNFSWDFALGAGIFVSEYAFGLNIIAPAEIVYNIPDILKGLDVYLQLKPIIPLYPKPTFDFEVGLGVRVGL